MASNDNINQRRVLRSSVRCPPRTADNSCSPTDESQAMDQGESVTNSRTTRATASKKRTAPVAAPSSQPQAKRRSAEPLQKEQQGGPSRVARLLFRSAVTSGPSRASRERPLLAPGDVTQSSNPTVEQSPRLSLGTSNQAESSTASASRLLNKQITTKSAQKRPLKTAEDEPQVKKPRAAITNNSGAGPYRRSTAPISARHTPAENDPLRPLPAHNDTEARKQRQAAIEVEQKLRAAKLRVFQMERLKNLCDQFRTRAREPHGEEVMYQRKCIAENEMKLARYEVDRIKGNLQGKSEADARQLLDAIRSGKGLLLAFELHPACIDPAPSTLAREWVFRTTMPDGDSGQLRELKQLAAAEDRSTPKVRTARWLDGLPASVAGFEKHNPAATLRVETKPPNSNARAQTAGTRPQAGASSNLSTRTQSRHRVHAARSRCVTDADDHDLEERLVQQNEEAAAYSAFVSEDRRERKRHDINMALLDFLMMDEMEDGYYLENSRSESDVDYSSSW